MAKNPPRWLNARLVIAFEWAGRSLTNRPRQVATRSRTTPSAPAASRRWPPGLNSAAFTTPTSLKRWTNSPSEATHSMAVPSTLPVMSCRLSLLNAAVATLVLQWLVEEVAAREVEDASAPAPPPIGLLTVTSNRPSGLIDPLSTGPPASKKFKGVPFVVHVRAVPSALVVSTTSPLNVALVTAPRWCRSATRFPVFVCQRRASPFAPAATIRLPSGLKDASFAGWPSRSLRTGVPSGRQSRTMPSLPAVRSSNPSGLHSTLSTGP